MQTPLHAGSPLRPPQAQPLCTMRDASALRVSNHSHSKRTAHRRRRRRRKDSRLQSLNPFISAITMMLEAARPLQQVKRQM